MSVLVSSSPACRPRDMRSSDSYEMGDRGVEVEVKGGVRGERVVKGQLTTEMKSGRREADLHVLHEVHSINDSDHRVYGCDVEQGFPLTVLCTQGHRGTRDSEGKR